ncbi:hypothetical protein ACH9EU_05395 [Kocuria sp. M1R5S2]
MPNTSKARAWGPFQLADSVRELLPLGPGVIEIPGQPIDLRLEIADTRGQLLLGASMRSRLLCLSIHVPPEARGLRPPLLLPGPRRLQPPVRQFSVGRDVAEQLSP